MSVCGWIARYACVCVCVCVCVHVLGFLALSFIVFWQTFFKSTCSLQSSALEPSFRLYGQQVSNGFCVLFPVYGYS